jgi:hypothetical protein
MAQEFPPYRLTVLCCQFQKISARLIWPYNKWQRLFRCHPLLNDIRNRRLVIENASDVHIGSRIKNPYASYLCDVRAVPPGDQRKSPCRGARQTKCNGCLPTGRQRQRPGKSPGLQSLR